VISFSEPFSTKLSLYLSDTNWIASVSKENELQVAIVVKEMIKSMTLIEAKISELFTDTKKDKAYLTSNNNAPLQFDALSGHIDRLFDKRLDYYGPVENNKEAIITSMIKLILKSFAEDIREHTFSKTGFQQIQLDLEYMRVSLSRLLSDENLLTTLLNQALSSVYKRSIDPLPLSSVVFFFLLLQLYSLFMLILYL
jgi:hypothetical protein